MVYERKGEPRHSVIMTTGYFPQPEHHAQITEPVFVQPYIFLMSFANHVTETASSTEELFMRGKLFIRREAISQEGRTFVGQQKQLA